VRHGDDIISGLPLCRDHSLCDAFGTGLLSQRPQRAQSRAGAGDLVDYQHMPSSQRVCMMAAEPERFIDAGESVVVPNMVHIRGRDGIEVSARSAIVFTFRSHRITRMCLYQETEQALKAVGLEE